MEEKRARHIESYLKSNPSRRFLLKLKKRITTQTKKRIVTVPKSKLDGQNRGPKQL